MLDLYQFLPTGDLFARMLQNGTDNNGTDANITDPCAAPVQSSNDTGYSVAINVLVFFTVWGISAVVDVNEYKKSFRNPPIYAGATFQFILMPFIGFLTVLIFPLDSLQAVTLLIMTASPGGSFSNWWCNLFNADLALSVSMTSLSTIASIAMMPLNILIYITVAYERIKGNEGDPVTVQFSDLGLTLGVVISAIILGMTTGIYKPEWQQICNIIGNIAGLASIILGVFASTDTCDGKPPWRQPFYPLWVATAFPLLVALVGVMILGTLLRLQKPQRVAIALETAYQNTSIALAYSISQGALGRKAAGIPVIYGGYEAGFFLLFMMGSWKAGWTYAPANERLWKVLFENYQPGCDNHKKLFPGYYDMKDEAIEFNKSIRRSFSFGSHDEQKQEAAIKDIEKNEPKKTDSDKKEDDSEEAEPVVVDDIAEDTVEKVDSDGVTTTVSL